MTSVTVWKTIFAVMTQDVVTRGIANPAARSRHNPWSNGAIGDSTLIVVSFSADAMQERIEGRIYFAQRSQVSEVTDMRCINGRI